MQQWVTIAKVGGKAAEEIWRRFQRWKAARVVDTSEPGLLSPDQWDDQTRGEIARFVDDLRQHAAQPPILFYCRYVDAWSGGYIFSSFIFPENSSSYMEVMSDSNEVLCYALPDDGALVARLRGNLRRKDVRERSPAETRWYLLILLEAFHAWEDLCDNSVLVVVREPFAGSIEDRQIAASLVTVPDWLLLD